MAFFGMYAILRIIKIIAGGHVCVEKVKA